MESSPHGGGECETFRAPRPRSRVLAGLRAKIELSSVSAAVEPRGYYIMRYPVGTVVRGITERQSRVDMVP